MVKTPSEKWKSSIIRHRKKCQSILSVSKSIRYAGVINEYGRTLTGIVRSDVKPLLKSEQVKNEFFILSTLMNLRKGSEKSVGKLEYVLLQHQKVSIVIFHKSKITYYVSIDKNENNMNKIISDVKKLL